MFLLKTMNADDLLRQEVTGESHEAAELQQPSEPVVMQSQPSKC